MSMIIERLIEFYQRSNGPDETVTEIWRGIVEKFHAPLLSALRAGNASEVQTVLNTPSLILHGVECPEIYAWDDKRSIESLNRLAQRVGVMPIANPEQPSSGRNWFSEDVQAMKAAVEKVIGSLDVPSGFIYPGVSGVHSTHFSKFGEWFTITRFLGRGPDRMLEIGAGVGNLAMIAFRGGVESYTVIDLPTVAMMSAYYVSSVCGPHNIHLWGEPENASAFGRWVPSSHYQDAKGQYDVIVNSNSFPEMEASAQDLYLKFICERLGSGVFYSNNHESDMSGQQRVFDAVQRNGQLELVYRAPFMVRPGYIEEIYRLK